MFVEITIPDALPLVTPLPALPPDPEPVETLRRARSRISSFDRWTNGAEARDGAQEPVMAYAPQAVAWCALGAVIAEADAKGVSDFQAVSLLAIALGNDETVIEYNDTPPRYHRWMGSRRLREAQHRRVLRLFDRAITES